MAIAKTMKSLFFLAAVFAHTAAVSQEDVATEHEPLEGRVIVYRPGAILGAAIGCPVRLLGEKVTELGRGKFKVLNLPEGRHILQNKTSSLDARELNPTDAEYVLNKLLRSQGRSE